MPLSISEYQNLTNKFAKYPAEAALDYLIHGLTSEAGEVAGKRKKFLRDHTEMNAFVGDLESELGDVLWYVAQLCEITGLSMETVMEANIAKLEDRLARNVVSGSGDKR